MAKQPSLWQAPVGLAVIAVVIIFVVAGILCLALSILTLGAFRGGDAHNRIGQWVDSVEWLNR